MRHKALAILGIVALVCSALLAAPAAASDPAPPTDLIAVDMDPYFKSLTGEAAYTKIRAETDASAAELAAAVAASEQDPSNRGQGKKSDTSGVSAAGVGDVEFLYADGWREFTLWALVTIWLSAACLKISVRRATGTAPESMMSARTCPGPTEGS